MFFTNKKSLTLCLLVLLLTLFSNSVFAGNPFNGEIFNVKDYGAVGDGTTFDMEAIQSAIDACYTAGGGTVYFPNGTFLTATLLLKSNVTLYLENGATLYGSPNLDLYKSAIHLGFSIDEHQVGIIAAENADNVSILGEGTIDGNGKVFWGEDWKPRDERPHRNIFFQNCTDVTIRDIKLINLPALVLYIRTCDRVNIDGIEIINPMRAPNTDGIDLNGCTNVTISNCYIETGDDAICFKSGRIVGPVEDVVISNCVLISDDTAIKMGTGSHKAMRRILVTGCVIKDTRYGISMFMKDGGIFEQVQFSNLIIHTKSRHVHDYPIFMDIESRLERPLGKIRDIKFSDITIISNGNSLIAGAPKSPIENLTFSNITFKADITDKVSDLKKPRGNRKLTGTPTPADFTAIPAHFTFGHINGLTINNMNTFVNNAEESYDRYAIFASNVTNLKIDSFDGKHVKASSELATLYLENCKNAMLTGCKSQPGTNKFIELCGEATEDITIMNNDFHWAETPIELKREVNRKEVRKSANILK